MAITPFINLPTPTSPDTFSNDADNFINVQLPRFAGEVDSIATAFSLNETNSTSTTSVLIGLGTKNFTVQTDRSYLAGMFILAADSSAPSTNYMAGQVLSYDIATGALSMDVVKKMGSGTFTAWSISQGNGGVGGGATGADGDDVFYENAQVITSSYTLTAGKNAMSTGNITINSGVTVTIPSGARWVIV